MINHNTILVIEMEFSINNLLIAASNMTVVVILCVSTVHTLNRREKGL